MSRHGLLLAAMLALAPTAAHADAAHEPPELAILFGPGVRAQWLRHRDTGDSESQLLPSFAETVAYRSWTHLALGLHANVTRSSAHVFEPTGVFGIGQDMSWNVISIDLAIAMQYERDRFTVTPWVGRHLSRSHQDGSVCRGGPDPTCTIVDKTDWTDDFTSYGLTASFRPVRRIPVAVFLVLQSGIGGTPHDTLGGELTDYSSATLGLAYQQ